MTMRATSARRWRESLDDAIRSVDEGRLRVRYLLLNLLLSVALASCAAVDNAPQSGAEAIGAAHEDFSARVSNAWCMASVRGNVILAMFQPNLIGMTDLHTLASAGGFDHFNIEQDIIDISGASAPELLPRWTGVDPLPGGNTFYQFDDQFPWYYNEVQTPGAWMPTYDNPSVLISGPAGEPIGLRWVDAPHIGPANAGATITFADYLVGVRADHSGVRISDAFRDARNVNFAWTFVQGSWGSDTRDSIRFAAFDQSEPGSAGAISILGYFDSDPSQPAERQVTNCPD